MTPHEKLVARVPLPQKEDVQAHITGQQAHTLPTYLDRPALTDELSRKAFAAALALRIRCLYEEEKSLGSFLIHLHGSWGSGKSSLLNLLGNELKEVQTPQPGQNSESWIIINFNAWMHQRLGTPWWWIMDAVFQQAFRQLRKIERLRSTKIYLKRFTWRFLRAGWPPYLLALLAIAGLFWLFSLNSAVGLLDLGLGKSALAASSIALQPLAQFAQSVSAIVAFIITIWGLIFGVSRSLFQSSTNVADSFLKSSRDPMKDITDHFNTLVSGIHYPIVVFIDDLDRCQSTYVVELLESIQTLFITASVTYVIAADKRWLCASYDKAYDTFAQTLEEPGRPLGYLFLEKAFQLSVSIPPMPQVIQERFWQRLLHMRSAEIMAHLEQANEQAESRLLDKRTEQEILAEISTSAQGEDILIEQALRQAAVKRLTAPEIEAETEQALRPFALLLEPTPRAMKKFVNTYSIQRAAAILTNANVSIQELALWTIINLRWPLLIEFLEDHPYMLKYLNGPLAMETALPESIPANLRDLFMSERVRDVVHGRDVEVSLTEEIIRQCSRLHAPASC
ncbi:KAP family P-loop NTPase fold protein [Ktedonospora formicarum]|uniref:KAP NTPase domain-containing protein n=1 Tax=Ktedonospora formicarum TaxID=2778364 RepID=A0A8J3HSZ2_9CHLR|nr:P-loop NTPase fold protein [Ktedonospora formicarum]GHO42696.1 hypothetical protein KSX_08590 [Ktedonospora formicarum]